MVSATLRLYVWEGVLTDYTDGIMLAVAESADAARKLIIDDFVNNRMWKEPPASVIADLKAEPEEWDLTEPRSLALFGGG